jgi:hypothetical protein
MHNNIRLATCKSLGLIVALARDPTSRNIFICCLPDDLKRTNFYNVVYILQTNVIRCKLKFLISLSLFETRLRCL